MIKKTTTPTFSSINRRWHLVDASDQILGRLATQVATLLMGKHKPDFVPHLDCGDYVVVVNSDRIKVTGNKLNLKTYYRHSGYPGGFKSQTLKEAMAADSTKVISGAVSGMLPKNKLRADRLSRLRIFTGADHTFADKFKSQSNTNSNENLITEPQKVTEPQKE